MDDEAILEQFKNSYNKTPYKSYPHHKSSPENLCSLGRLFGVKTPSIESAKILELGCSEGHNLLPHAANFPHSTFVGVDLSSVHINAANNHVKNMGLSNVTFHNCSITDINKDWGQFDYIIAHGVISWVPNFVREKIFSVCSKNLSENGIAYISYNVLPGWNIIRGIRNMMIYATANLLDPAQKVSKARKLLNVIADSLQGSNNFYAQTLQKEAIKISKHEDYYIRHEYLEEENKQYYFHEFLAEVEKHKLQYLSDCSLSSIYPNKFLRRIDEVLEKIEEVAQVEQYMDFLTNRRFRSSLLVHSKIGVNRKISSEIIKNFTITTSIIPEYPLAKVNLHNTQENLKFFYNTVRKSNFVFSNSPVLKSVLYVLSENICNPLTFSELVNFAADKLKVQSCTINESELSDSLLNLLLKGFINLSLFPGKKHKVCLDKPKLMPYAYYQVTKMSNPWITNSMHKKVNIDNFDQIALRYMNGKNTQNQIVDLIIQAIKTSNTQQFNTGNYGSNNSISKKIIIYYLKNCIQKLSSKGVFI